MALTPYVPDYITVHLGAPQDNNVPNVTVSFTDYIKNVASSEVYPTWENSALYANIYAQISFTLNRVFLEFYRSSGYSFNITSSTEYDQKFIYGRNIFANISKIVDEIFNEYIRRQGFIEPLAAIYCNGTTVTCNGLSQWGSQQLAKQEGYNSIDILKYYYGRNIELVVNTPVLNLQSSYPGSPLQLGSTGRNVILIQDRINRISNDYPDIPKIYPVDGIFGPNTESAVFAFQRDFELDVDGIVGKATWYKINSVYTAVKKLGELESEGLQLIGESFEYPDAVAFGDRGEKVTILQYFLAILSEFYPNIPYVAIDGIFGNETLNSVKAFQQFAGLPETGVVNNVTWNELYKRYQGIANTFLENHFNVMDGVSPFGGTNLALNSTGKAVFELQGYLNKISTEYNSIPTLSITGVYDQKTEEAVKEYQRIFGLEETGVVNEETWNDITSTYINILSSTYVQPTQFPGYALKEE